MNRYALYRVSGRRRYRGHEPGSTFEASIDRAAEARAVARGDLQVLKRITPALEPDSWRLPHGWPPKPVAPPANNGGPHKGPLLIEEA